LIVNFIQKQMSLENNVSDFFLLEGQKVNLKTPSGVIESDGIFSSDEILSFASSSDEIRTEMSTKLSAGGSVDFKREIELDSGLAYIRGNLFSSLGKVCCVARILSSTAYPIDYLNIDPRNLKNLKEILKSKSGLIIFSGPTGSGKSTTISSAISWIAENSRKVILTVEDPVEFIFKESKSLIMQKQVGSDVTSFEAGIIDSLRQAPDIIFIGEVRRPEEFYAAITAAETGHLVITTMHTPQIESIPGRIINTFPSEKSEEIRAKLASVLKLLVTQRLIEESGEIISYYEFLTVDSAIKSLILQKNDLQMSTYVENQNENRVNDVLVSKFMSGQIDFDTAISLSTDAFEVMKRIGKDK